MLIQYKSLSRCGAVAAIKCFNLSCSYITGTKESLINLIYI